MPVKVACLYVEEVSSGEDVRPRIHLYSGFAHSQSLFPERETHPFPQGSVLVLGVMDGVHRGHQHLIQAGREVARREGRPLVVSTFVPHPGTLLQKRRHFLLTLPEERFLLFEALGIQYVLLFVFTEALARLTPHQFVDEVLGKTLAPAHIVTGENFRFGYRAQGTASHLKALTRQIGIQTHVFPLVHQADHPISSSRVRHLIQAGAIQSANALLGYPWFLTGKVVQGDQIGRRYLVPTANLHLPEGKLHLAPGIYGGWVQCQSDGSPQPAAIYVGQRPTLRQHTDGQRPVPPSTDSIPRVEVHLLDAASEPNLYEQWLRVFIQFRVRSDERFPTLTHLARQIQEDLHVIRQQLSTPEAALSRQIAPSLQALIDLPVRPVRSEPDIVNLCFNSPAPT